MAMNSPVDAPHAVALLCARRERPRGIAAVPFLVTIAKKARDKDLAKKLEPEWPGILRWMIDGCPGMATYRAGSAEGRD
jgi:hypothetical protein